MPEHLLCPHCGGEVEKYRNPLPTTDVIIEYDGKVVLINRENYPLGWAIPGGFIDYGESAEDAAHREMMEETGLQLENLQLFTVRSKLGRDPRHHTLTVIYSAIGKGVLKAGDDAADAKLFDWDALPDEMAFDHRDILEEYKNDSSRF
ncbi:NUDIX hydrolase [bacterium]|nr:NUDIX hydrolase [bacterium]